ncbi:MAG: MBOAT family protein [Methylobacter tundripaludum]|uniref:Probable alginate O-acetylase n=1 Tax=Methylobacter tundripaludum TaxID=173365 RepID=A0A2S6H2B1_9GAMM|nr:MBOAT family O-acyltransferase [Methylobacter tundripaludum]MCK9637429.1 MBOAT family protein [Methylobacter tundripaludum]PPK71593.1 alginate O-acetyltransferase complex protein AlgI [Methylobacter tundripaludum]
MLFNSPLFLLVFIPLFLMAYFAVPGIRLRNAVIVLFSIFFFAWGDPVFVWYVIAGTWIDYMIIKHVLMNPTLSEEVKKGGLVVAILINVGALLFFKYANFFVDQVQPLLHMIGIEKPSWYGVALPLGISFIAFHKISFVLDLYKQRTSPPASFIEALLYILFFPQLIAGPIIRYHEISQQIRVRTHSAEEFIAGFFRFARGLGKKALIADPAGEIANAIFALPPESLPSHYAWVGVLAYSVQIYFDFSGYSDMAIGLGRVVGFRFPENFNQPYTAKSVTEFWQRWHITLSNWMRLYLYIPLGGNKVAPWRMYFNLWIVFLISGLWHGAAWNFVLWGAYYGFFLTLEKMCERRGWDLPMPGVVKQLLTFVIIINAWVLFRAESLDYAIQLLGRMYGLIPQLQPTTEPFALIFPPHGLVVIVVGLLIAVIPLPEALHRLAMVKDSLKLDSIRWAASIVLFWSALSSIMASGSSSFLYFRF